MVTNQRGGDEAREAEEGGSGFFLFAISLHPF